MYYTLWNTNRFTAEVLNTQRDHNNISEMYTYFSSFSDICVRNDLTNSPSGFPKYRLWNIFNRKRGLRFKIGRIFLTQKRLRLKHKCQLRFKLQTRSSASFGISKIKKTIRWSFPESSPCKRRRQRLIRTPTETTDRSGGEDDERLKKNKT